MSDCLYSSIFLDLLCCMTSSVLPAWCQCLLLGVCSTGKRADFNAYQNILYRVFSSDFNSHLCTFFSSNFTILVFGNTIKVKFLSVLPAIVMFGILMAFALFLNNILDSISRQKKDFAVVLLEHLTHGTCSTFYCDHILKLSWSRFFLLCGEGKLHLHFKVKANKRS